MPRPRMTDIGVMADAVDGRQIFIEPWRATPASSAPPTTTTRRRPRRLPR
ncbi:MAG: hypothetical protein IPF99_27015 [Deltaproteobacteria bacterium]|nr:hypothetical protein [Deltaproteobacteria bacterium]